jgi:hypothetical protein
VKPIGDVAGSLGISAHDHTIVEATRAAGDQIKIKQFGKAAVMFRAINAAGEVVQVFGTRACGGLRSPSGGLPWNA